MRLKGFALATGLLLLLLSNNSFSQVQTARNISMVPNSGGFYEYLPQGYNTGSENYPLIIFIHGIGEVGNGTTQLPLVLNNAIPKLINQGTFPTSFTVNGQTFKFIVISPQFLGWPVPTDISGIIDYLVLHYRVDQTRIYVTGLSMGGGATWDYGGGAPQYANRLAALLPVCGASYPEPVRCRVITASNLPVWAIHNSDDPTVPVSYTNDYITNINMAPSPTPLAKKTIFQASGHDAWSKAYDPNWKEDGVNNVYTWMLQYTNVRAAAPVPNQPPVVIASSSAQTITLPNSTITLTGTASDPDGSIASYSWTQVGGDPATITSPNSATTTVTGINTVGAKVFRFKATDNKGAISFTDVTVNVNPPLKSIPSRIEAENWDAKSGPQYAVASNDPSGGVQQVIGLANGSYMDYNVNVITGGTYTITFRIATTQNYSQYQLKLGSTVLTTFNVPNTGGWGNWSSGTATATIPAGNQLLRLVSTGSESSNINWMDFALNGTPPVNQSPTANAGANQTITLPTATATLTGSGSDPDGTIASYAWSQTSGTAATIANPTSASTTITGLTTSGVRTFRLTVKDNTGAPATSDVTVTVNDAATPPPPPTNGKTVPGRVEAESWDAKSGNQYAVTTADAGGGQQVVGLTLGNTMNYNVNVTTTGTYTVSFRVASTQLHAQLQLKSGATVLGTANVPNTGGWDIWTTVSVPNVSLTAGTQTLQILSANSETCNFNWIDFTLTSGTPPNQPPVVNAGTNQSVTLPATTATLTGSATDADGTVSTYAWTQVSGAAATIVNPGSPTTSITGLTTSGARVFKLTVMDNGGATASSTVTVTENDAAPPPPTNGKTIPGRIETENWDAKSGYQYAVATSDVAGSQHVVGITNGAWMDYNVNVLTAGTYTVTFRIATTQALSQFQIKSGATVLGTINIPNTGSWSTWANATTTINLPAGTQTLRVISTNSESCNFNYMDFALAGQTGKITSAAVDKSTATVTKNSAVLDPAFADGTIDVYPNPVKDQFVLRSNNNYEGTMKIQVLDNSGRVAKVMQASKSKGRSEINLSTAGLTAGTYIVRVQMGDTIKSIKLLKL